MASTDNPSSGITDEERPEGSPPPKSPIRDQNHTPLNLVEETPSGKDHTPLALSSVEDSLGDSDAEEEGEGQGMGQLLRATVEELEGALQDTRQLLAARDKELGQLKHELDRYRTQAAKEIANKTRLAQALDQSQSHAAQLEELLQNWQLQLREFKVQGERLESALRAEQVKNQELESHLVLSSEREKEARGELEQCRILLQTRKDTEQRQQQEARSPTSPVLPAIDSTQQMFLKQAVYHLLIDFHAEEQLRAIISILDFTAQERMAVYSKMQEKGLYKK